MKTMINATMIRKATERPQISRIHELELPSSDGDTARIFKLKQLEINTMQLVMLNLLI